MSTDNGAWSDYDGVMDDLQKDDRIGDHDFLIDGVETGKWSDLTPTGSDDPYFKVTGVLLTAGQAKASVQWSPPPPAATVKAEMTTWKPGKRKAIAQAVSLARQLEQHYGLTFAQLKAGDILRVKTIKTRRDEDTGKGGFIRVAAILPKDGIGQASVEKAQAAADIPF